MPTNQKKYYHKNIDGYSCLFNRDTHICAAVMLATGMDIKAWKDFNTKMVGSMDPDYKKTIS